MKKFFSRFLIIFCVSLFVFSVCFSAPGYLYDERRHPVKNHHTMLEKKLNRFAVANSFSRKSAFSKPVPKEAQSILIIAPHPDDEILCCSDVIQKSLQKGLNVKIVVVTNGDALSDEYFLQSRWYGSQRASESLAAARKMGLDKNDIFFLGFPDQGLQHLSDVDVYSSPFTHQTTTNDHSSFPFRPYTRKELKKSILFFLSSWDLEALYIPSPDDQHPDHKVVGEIVLEILQEKEMSPLVFTYLVHNHSLFTDQEPFVKSNQFKLSLIHLFASQFWTDQHRSFMEQFSHFPETFSSLSFP
jgi:LmbE family N-acetylglucosaminyl deacetylase